ncbi:protein of unknown function (plasmid) [Caballeronia sp. S22]
MIASSRFSFVASFWHRVETVVTLFRSIEVARAGLDRHFSLKKFHQPWSPMAANSPTESTRSRLGFRRRGANRRSPVHVIRAWLFFQLLLREYPEFIRAAFGAAGLFPQSVG